MAPHRRMFSPAGSEITGTYENLAAVASVSIFERSRDGVDYEHDGDTEIFWDGQETVCVRGEAVFRDANGALCVASELAGSSSGSSRPRKPVVALGLSIALMTENRKIEQILALAEMVHLSGASDAEIGARARSLLEGTKPSVLK